MTHMPAASSVSCHLQVTDATVTLTRIVCPSMWLHYTRKSWCVCVQILQMSKEQHGCRYLQRLLASAGPKEVQSLLDEILPHTGELMVDPFGNYLVQKVLDVCTPTQRRAVLECACEAGLPEIACNTHGTRAAQKLVESVRKALPCSLFNMVVSGDVQCFRMSHALTTPISNAVHK